MGKHVEKIKNCFLGTSIVELKGLRVEQLFVNVVRGGVKYCLCEVVLGDGGQVLR